MAACDINIPAPAAAPALDWPQVSLVPTSMFNASISSLACSFTDQPTDLVRI